MESRPSFNFEFVETDDGSPSVYLWSDGSKGSLKESMHNIKGAFSETLYIYFDAMKTVSERGWPARFLSMGLGLGYNELILAALALRAPANFRETLFITSYEKEDFLTQSFFSWLGENQTSNEWHQTYDKILNIIAKHFEVSGDEIKKVLMQLQQQGRWELLGAANESTQFKANYSAILYDAFSRKMSPELWEQDFITRLIRDGSGPNCVLTTYAATGNLKRALEINDFVLHKRPGYSGKRESSLAIKERS